MQAFVGKSGRVKTQMTTAVIRSVGTYTEWEV